ncbi:MAG TPA: isoleucine--tRNA ligase [Spirochaetota bacterium]|nr:isoleucine--tRNA ligase [Spirochaetota bacterium]
MDYSKTVNLPATDFPMRANLPQREPGIAKKWQDEKIYSRIQESRKGAKTYILHDGPPYANGHLHLGHALNKILKDIIVKHHTMLGQRSPYVPGWDCHGLPIELNVTRELGDKAKEMPRVEIRKKCREYAESFVKIQMEEFKRLGVFGDYDNPYKTMSPEYETRIVEVFGELLKEGYIYRNKKPIYWCPTCVTALAEAEVEYDNHISSSVYVKFKVDPSTVNFGGDRDKTYVVIWTTTPWTLPANLAVSFHPEFEYASYKFGGENYILAKGLLEQFESITGMKNAGEIALSIDNIKSLKVLHPFIDRESKVVFGTHVTLEQGTGIVHTAPGHGHDDYIVGLANNLEIFCPVDDEGKFTSDFPEMKGMHVFKANPEVVKLLESKNALVHSGTIEHSYPHCWRCKKPLIYRATEQWFFGMDHKDLRKKGLESVDKTEWVPTWGETRFRGMVETRPDWCLSRQRSWGVPIPSFRCADCGKNLMTAESVRMFADISRKDGIDSWYTKDIRELIPAGTKCTCGCENLVKEFDILDVWFDSGVSHFAVLDQREDLSWPADIYLEGSDQHRGWFQSSLWPAIALRGRAPFNTVLTHGFMLDENGKAMSKSLGNVIPPEKIIDQFGADILRLWVSSEDYRNDVRIGMNMMQQVAESYKRIRNTLKYIIGNIADSDEKDAVDYDELTDIDKWVLHKLYQLSDNVIKHYSNYEFHLVYRRLLNFCAVELSSIYFDVSKDILYVEAKNAKIRRGDLTVLREIYNCIVRLIAPVLSFTAEEIWEFNGHKGSVHMEKYYKLDEKFNNPAVHDRINKVVEIKKDVLKSLEELRKEKLIKTSLEADVKIYVKDEAARALMSEMGEELRRFLQVAKVELCSSDSGLVQYDSSAAAATKSTGQKCVRCWNFFDKLGSDPEHPEICARCTSVIKSL